MSLSISYTLAVTHNEVNDWLTIHWSAAANKTVQINLTLNSRFPKQIGLNEQGKVFKYRDLKSAGTTKLRKDFELFFNEPKNFSNRFDSFIEFDFNGTLHDWGKLL